MDNYEVINFIPPFSMSNGAYYWAIHGARVAEFTIEDDTLLITAINGYFNVINILQEHEGYQSDLRLNGQSTGKYRLAGANPKFIKVEFSRFKPKSIVSQHKN